MRIVKTHTGKIYVDKDKKLEFLTVGDYGKENNIKASFLGLNKEINGVQHHTVDLADKWVATISTQKGCPMNCQFCDCPKYGFHGNVTLCVQNCRGTVFVTMLWLAACSIVDVMIGFSGRRLELETKTSTSLMIRS